MLLELMHSLVCMLLYFFSPLVSLRPPLPSISIPSHLSGTAEAHQPMMSQSPPLQPEHHLSLSSDSEVDEEPMLPLGEVRHLSGQHAE